MLEFEKAVFSRVDIEQDVSLKLMRENSKSRRIVLTLFNEDDAIIRWIIEYTMNDNKMNIKDKREYRAFREITMWSIEIVYKRDWEKIDEAKKERRVFNIMQDKKWTLK